MHQSHDDLGKPLMGGPGDWRGYEGENVRFRYGEGIQYVLSCPDVVAGVRVVQESLAGGEREVNENGEEQHVGDGR